MVGYGEIKHSYSDHILCQQGFYEEVATPLLTDVAMIYMGGTNLTKTNFSQYYNGSEIVVAGQILDNDVETFIPQVVAISVRINPLCTSGCNLLNPLVKFPVYIFSQGTRTVRFLGTNATETVSDDRIQRVWAYLTVKQLLEKE